MENTLFAYFENRIFPAPAMPQQKDSLQLFLDDCGIPDNADSPFYRSIVQRRLDTIPPEDRERYFRHYAKLHTVRVITENLSINGKITEKERHVLRSLLPTLEQADLQRYVSPILRRHL